VTAGVGGSIRGAMETANLIFRMTHPALPDLDAATALARAIVDKCVRLRPLTPGARRRTPTR
jgi:hypothetical protein